MNDETQRPEKVNLLDSLPEFKKSASASRPPVAVALKDDKKRQDSPRITASGRGPVAEQILQLAFAHGVKVREDADLAEVLAALELDSPIPLEAFAAVAEIMTYLYQANAAYRKDTL